MAAPGFVDPHTHYDAQLMWDPTASPSGEHGVTSVVGGNCSFGLAPIDPEHVDYVRGLLAKVEGMPIEALTRGADWSWRDFGSYLDALDRARGLRPYEGRGRRVAREVRRQLLEDPDDPQRPLLEGVTQVEWVASWPWTSDVVRAGVTPSKATLEEVLEFVALPDEDDVAFALRLIQDPGVASVPGSSFFSRRELGRTKVRFAFPKRTETLLAATERLARVRVTA